MRLLGSIANKDRNGNVKFVSEIREDDDGRVFFTADADIDADGANGQNGGPVAYTKTDTGTDFLANAAMRIRADGKVVCKNDNARSIVILGPDNEPKVFPGGMIASKTWYRHPGKAADDPAAYVDSETVPYMASCRRWSSRRQPAWCGAAAPASLSTVGRSIASSPTVGPGRRPGS